MKSNVKLSHPDKAGANLVKLNCGKESPQPGRAAGKGWLQRLVRAVSDLRLIALLSQTNPVCIGLN